MMKLYSSDNSDLMEVSEISKDGRNLIVEGTIMGAMPIRAVVKPDEIRRAIGGTSWAVKFHVLTMLFRGSR